MILSKNILPSAVEGTEDLYYRTEGDVTIDDGNIILGKDSSFSLYTFFNLFPLAQYREYATVSDVHVSTVISGDVIVEIVGRIGSDETIIHSERCIGGPCEVRYTVAGEYDSVFVRYRSYSDSRIVSLPEYGCDDTPRDISVSGVICTYRREDYIRRNSKRITEYFGSRGLPCRFSLYIVDNGNTLSEGDVPESDMIRIFPNPNTGGSGGFARGMLESMDSGFDYSVLMDDDIDLEPEVLARTLCMISLLKDGHSRSNIVGQLLERDSPTVMEERVFENGRMTSRFSHTDMSIEDSLGRDPLGWGNCRGWWFCSLMLDEDCLPLPLFFQYDDLDYFLRNSENGVIGFTGVGIWHHSVVSALESKSKIMYYGERNRMIVESVHDVRFTGRLRHYINRAVRAMVDEDHNSLELLNMAMRDYLSGPDCIMRICNSEKDAIVRGYNDSREIKFGPLCRWDLFCLMRRSLSPRGMRGLLSTVMMTIRYVLFNGGIERKYHSKYREMRSVNCWMKLLRDEDGRDQKI